MTGDGGVLRGYSTACVLRRAERRPAIPIDEPNPLHRVTGSLALVPSGQDELWGRMPGARPPLRARTPLLFAAVSGVLLTAVVLLLVRTPGPLDESTFADQRNGLLARGAVVDRTVDGVNFGDTVVVLLFVRKAPSQSDLRAWAKDLPGYVTVRVVVQRPDPTTRPGGNVVFDRLGQLAAAVGLPNPNDGGPGVGYAVVDANGTVRYATLDPSWRGNGFEVATIVGAL